MGEVPRKKVVVVGSGVIGLSIALQLKVSCRYEVVIIARDLPADGQSRQFASPWAGANWASSTSDPNQQRWDEATFKQWAKWTKQLPKETIVEMPFSLYYHRDGYKKQVSDWHASFLPEYRSEPHGEKDLKSTFRGITLNVPAFLTLLEEQLKSTPSSSSSPSSSSKDYQLFPSPPTSYSSSSNEQCPVQFIRATVKRLSDVFQHVPDADLIVNATGLGARYLEDVADKTVYPVRGQTVLIQASKTMLESPVCSMSGPKTVTFTGRKSKPEDQEFDYVIPRAQGGTIICGGCAIPDEYNTEVDSALSERILQRCVKLVPQLLDDNPSTTTTKLPSQDDAWKSIKVLAQGVGLRPAREKGMRLEFEQLTSENGGRSFHTLHAYGAGGGGYQSGYGIAVDAGSKIDDFFAV